MFDFLTVYCWYLISRRCILLDTIGNISTPLDVMMHLGDWKLTNICEIGDIMCNLLTGHCWHFFSRSASYRLPYSTCLTLLTYMMHAELFEYGEINKYIIWAIIRVICWQGMVAPGEKISLTLQREFSEETMNSLECTSKAELALITRKVREFFKGGWEVDAYTRLDTTSSWAHADLMLTSFDISMRKWWGCVQVGRETTQIEMKRKNAVFSVLINIIHEDLNIATTNCTNIFSVLII